MFDSIKLHVNAVTRPFENYSPGLLTDMDRFKNFEDGHFRQKAKLKNLRLTRTRASLTITGSLATWVHGHNVHPLSPEEMKAALQVLSDIVEADLDDADVWSLEVGETLLLDEPASRYLQCLQDQPRYELDLLGSGSTVRFRQATKSLQFYNKGRKNWRNLPEEFNDLNLLRVEFKFKNKLRKNLKGREVKGRDLYNNAFISMMVKRWYEEYRKIYKSRVARGFEVPISVNTPRDLTTILAAYAVADIGLDRMMSIMQEMRPRVLPKNNERMVKLIRDLSQHTDFTTTESLVDELDRKMLEIARKYCPGEMFENEIQGETTPFLGIEQ